MFHALGWFVIGVLLALWSLTAWALHSVAVWAVSNAGALAGAASGADVARLPAWLAKWVPVEWVEWSAAMFSGLVLAIASLLQSAPALEGGLGVAAWVVWTIGSAGLVLLGAAMHVIVTLWRSGGTPPPAGRALAAG